MEWKTCFCHYGLAMVMDETNGRIHFILTWDRPLLIEEEVLHSLRGSLGSYLNQTMSLRPLGFPVLP